MRDINRIEPFLEKLGEAWKKHPDLRFGQFMSILFGAYGKDPFYVEDDAWLAGIDAYIKGEDVSQAMSEHMKTNTERHPLFTQEELDSILSFVRGEAKGE